MGCGCGGGRVDPAPPNGAAGGSIVYVVEGGSLEVPQSFTQIGDARTLAVASGGRVRSMRA